MHDVGRRLLLLGCVITGVVGGCGKEEPAPSTGPPARPACFPDGDVTGVVSAELARGPKQEISLRISWKPGAGLDGAPLPATVNPRIPYGLECVKPFVGALDTAGLEVSGGERSIRLTMSQAWLDGPLEECKSRTLRVPFDLMNSEYDQPCEPSSGERGRPMLVLTVGLTDDFTGTKQLAVDASRWKRD